MGAATFQKVVGLGLINERSKLENRGAEGVGSGVSPSPADYGVWGNVVSSPYGVRGRAPAVNAFLGPENIAGKDKNSIYLK